MHYSIRHKLAAILIIIIGGVIYLTWFLNLVFAESYYEASEKANIVTTFHKVKMILEEDQSQSELEEELSQICNTTNIKMMIVKSNDYFYSQDVVFSNLVIDTSSYHEIAEALDQLRSQLMFGQSEKEYGDPIWGNRYSESWDTLVNKGYLVCPVRNRDSGENGIYLFGFTDDDYMMAMRISLDSIQTSVKIGNSFLGYTGLIGMLIGGIAIYVVSIQFTNPIKEMAVVADRMTQLDFDAKVHVETHDEMEELGNSMNKLSETLESTIADLKSANLELQKDIAKKEQIDEMRKEFLSHVSHELKTPIALIQGYAEGLSENINDDEESREFYCEVIADEAQKMNLMVQKLLTLNQIEFGNTQLDMQRFDICQLIENKVQASQILIMKNDNRVCFEEKGPVYVWADEFMIEEVFSNYFSNALHHVTPSGMIRIWFEYRNQDLRVHVFNEGKQIPQEDLEKLWIKFYKVDKARTREYGGSGIGLSIVAATMKAHGKQFGVNNVENGVDFYFDLDCKTAKETKKV